MIVFDLTCGNGHRFEGWFASSGDFESQRERSLVTCPTCASHDVSKALMAPALQAKGNTQPAKKQDMPSVTAGDLPLEVTKAMEALAKAQSKALEKSEWVGDKFADTSRAMHYGDKDETAIHGKATPKEAKDLLDEGITVTPLPFPVASPDDLN
ncbi:DUF1178 family protein [Altererythrobacter sp. ZODW24]|uniref:DUF1178 family protein n=1 Tax=Altererythrobacter sp. ZODW24 TaxID=2185142 RepID=UPI000DF82D8B|nr:DUF1178 family protein [Altererythrobacter sp. ZODW24]